MRIVCLSLAILPVTWSTLAGATINVPADQPTIQSAIDAAVSGIDEVVVAPGTYNEIIDFNGKAITVRSTAPTDPAEVAATIIDATGLNDSGVLCISGEGSDTVLDGFTVTGGVGHQSPNGSTTSGGGMYILQSDPTITNCVFTGNVGGSGGGMYNDGSSPTVTDCTFQNNTAYSVGGGMLNSSASPTVTNCTFDGNTAACCGGGMRNSFSSVPIISNCEFTGNTADLGGGVDNWLGSAPIITDCVFAGNIAMYGGGMYLRTAEDVKINRCTFRGNSAVRGGGMFNNVSRKIEDCLFIDNIADQDGGGVFGLFSSWLIDCAFSGNTAGHNGGGIFTYGWLRIENCRFSGNTAEYDGGAIRIDSTVLEATNCLFTGNVAMNSGGAMMAFPNADLTLTNCTVTGNSATFVGGLIVNDTPADIFNCIFWDNGPDDEIWAFDNGPGSFKEPVVVEYCDVRGGWSGLGSNNIDADPLFVTGPLGDFYLSQTAAGQAADSPCVDAGNKPQSVIFLKGTTRTDDIGDLGIVDMGFHYDAGLGSVDFDGDGDADADDFLTFSNCFAGALNRPKFGCQSPSTDLDDDGDVDVFDFLTFSNCFNGSLKPPKCP